MDRRTFEKESVLVEFCKVSENLFFALDLSVFYPASGKEGRYESWDELFALPWFANAVAEMDSVLIDPCGGRGATSASENLGTFGFNHAAGNSADHSKKLFPAEFNDGERFQSFDKALSKFQEKYANADIEYAINVDEYGYVTTHMSGNPTSVAIASVKDNIVVHNHPSGGHFSDTDLLSMAQTVSSGIVAVGSKATYIVKKTAKFAADAFAKAVTTARMTGKTYDDAVHKWLTANQSKYGYTYERRNTT